MNQNPLMIDRIFRISKKIDNFLLTTCHNQKLAGKNTNKSKILREIVTSHMAK